MFKEEEALSVIWDIKSITALTVSQDIFDVIVVDYKGLVTYYSDPMTAYSAPTDEIEGTMTFTFTPDRRGIWKILLVTGTSSNYTILDTVEVPIACTLPIVSGSTKAITSYVNHPKCILKAAITSENPLWANVEQLYDFASDGEIIIVAGYDNVTNGVVFRTDFQLFAHEVLLFAVDIPVIIGFSQWVDHVVYAPEIDTWLIGSTHGYLHYSTDSGDTWTEITYPAVGHNPGTSNIQEISWIGGQMGLFYFGNSAALFISPDGINWTKQSDTEALGGTWPEQIKIAARLTLGVNTWDIISQWEEYCVKVEDDQGSTGWFKTPNNGLIGGAGGLWGTYNWQTADTKIIAHAFGNIIYCTNPSSHLNWTEISASLDVPWDGNHTIEMISYFPEYDRPWIVQTRRNGIHWWDSLFLDLGFLDFATLTNSDFLGRYGVQTSKTLSQNGRYYDNVGNSGKWGMIIRRYKETTPNGTDGNDYILMKA